MVIRQKKLFWQIFLVHLAILLLAIGLVAWYSSRTFDDFYLDKTGADLQNRAYLIHSRVLELLSSGDTEILKNFAITSGRASGTRITVIMPDGKVIADTNEDPEVMDNHRQRPEIDTAFSGIPGQSLRFSNTLGQRMLYSAIPLYQTGAAAAAGREQEPVIAVLRLSMPVTAIDSALSDIRIKIAGGAVLAIVGAFIMTFLVSRNISLPLEEMTRGAEQYARGDFSQRMLWTQKKSASKEIASLATAMDQMAGQLDEKIKTIINQRNQLETVFSSMVEAVIAVDLEERIISINQAAAQMFGVERQGAQGRVVQEVIRNVALHQQIARILEKGEAFEDEIILTGKDGNTYLQTHVVPLYGVDTRTIGALVVLNDVTRLRRLERMRSDFVANVSHELRTPITSIRGYVETLLDGALDERQDALKFLEIVLLQSEQLEEIIDDLLALSRIEKEAKQNDVAAELQDLRPVLEEAMQTVSHKAEERGLSLELDCPEHIRLKINQTLFEQALVNLLNNAITYSEAGQQVMVRAREVVEEGRKRVKISVLDEGIGIGEEHLPRLFERFYRSDRARNRKEGGTGLGLAIVKHIVQAHGGEVEVQSKIGVGSEFIVILDGA
ncbi:MAG: ATP-binding protein [Desulfocapsaceae bacterium]